MTEKQKIFADEYLVDLNATRAYKTAYPNVKNDATAAAAAARLLRNVKVQEYVEEKLKELESKRIASVQEVLEYLTAVMRREKKESVVITLLNEKTEYIPDATGVPRKTTVKEEIPQIVEIPTKVSDANKAAELLGKRYALFTDKVDMDADTEINITIDYGGDVDAD